MKKLWSIFTTNMNKCIYSGYEDPEGTPYPQIERHHVFGGRAYKQKCERYGFIAPLHKTFHPNGVDAPEDWKLIDEDLKQRCQRYWEENIGTREAFMHEFGQNYLDWE